MLHRMRKSIMVAALAVIGVVAVTAGCATAPASSLQASAVAGGGKSVAGPSAVLATVPPRTAAVGLPSSAKKRIIGQPVVRNCISTPHQCGFPDGTNTGVSAGTHLTVVPQGLPNCSSPTTENCTPPTNGSVGKGWYWDYRGYLVAATTGAVIQDVSTAGTIDIRAPNVTVRDTLVDCACGQSGYDVIIRDTDTGAVANADNATIEDSTLTDSTDSTYADVVEESGVGGMKILRSNLSGAGNGVHNGDGGPSDLIEDSYIHNLANCCGFHDEDVHIDSGGPMVMIHNTFLNQLDQTASVIINQDAPPPPSNITIEDNLLAGGDYSIYGGDAGSAYSGPATYIRIINNRLSPIYFSKIGQWGWLAIYDHNTGNVCSGNINDATGAALSC